MAWRIEIADSAKKQLAKLDKTAVKRIISFLKERIALNGDPRSSGKALAGELRDLWRYRVGDYRIVCEIQDRILCILVVRVGHRSDIYR